MKKEQFEALIKKMQAAIDDSQKTLDEVYQLADELAEAGVYLPEDSQGE